MLKRTLATLAIAALTVCAGQARSNAADLTPPTASRALSCGAVHYTITNPNPVDVRLVIIDTPPDGIPYEATPIIVAAGQTRTAYYAVQSDPPATDELQLIWNGPDSNPVLLDDQVPTVCATTASPTPTPSRTPPPVPTRHHVVVAPPPARPHYRAQPTPQRHITALVRRPQLASTGASWAPALVVGVLLVLLGGLLILAGQRRPGGEHAPGAQHCGPRLPPRARGKA